MKFSKVAGLARAGAFIGAVGLGAITGSAGIAAAESGSPSDDRDSASSSSGPGSRTASRSGSRGGADTGARSVSNAEAPSGRRTRGAGPDRPAQSDPRRNEAPDELAERLRANLDQSEVTTQVTPALSAPAAAVGSVPQPSIALPAQAGTAAEASMPRQAVSISQAAPTVSPTPAPASTVVPVMSAAATSPSPSSAATGTAGDQLNVLIAAMAVISRELNRLLFNRTPTANPVQYGLTAGGVATGTMGGSDPEGDPLDYAIDTAPGFGSAVVDGDGNYTYTAGAELMATGGTDTFTVTVRDTGFRLNFWRPASVTVPVSVTVPTPIPTPVPAPIVLPAISIASNSANESDSTAGQLTFAARLDRASDDTVRVDYATSDGTASAGQDYTATSGTLTFAPGVTAQQVAVAISGDTVAEPDETFTITLSNPTGATLADAVATGVIVNDDAPLGDGGTVNPALTAADRGYWTSQRGVGFSVGSLGSLEGQQRLEAALQEAAQLGFVTIRTWGTDDYTGRILEAITRLDLPLMVQAGIYITREAEARGQIDSALAVIEPYADKVVGVSLGNEQIVDWNGAATLTVPEVIGQVRYFKSLSSLPVTYNFAGETFLPGASQWGQDLVGLVTELDYINVHSYGGFFDNRNNPAWTPQRQLDAVKAYESLLADTLNSLGLGSKPIILGETGWQSTGYDSAVTNPARQQEYYEMISSYVYGDDARFDGMFYFNLTDEAWKGGDDNWGLFREGQSDAIGESKFTIAPVSQILDNGSTTTPDTEPETPGAPELSVVEDRGSLALLVDPQTGLAYVQSGDSAAALAVTRDDSYWSGPVPLTRVDATLQAAAIDAQSRLRLLDSSSYGRFGWILDDNGHFIGEERYDASTLPAAESLFEVDLDGDGRIGASVPVIDLPTSSAYERTGFRQGEFVANIAFSHRATADPIVAPGNLNFPHAHDFFGNPTTGADSTVATLLEATQGAAIPLNNISAYWAPSLIDEGSDGLGGERRFVDPLPTSIAYYSVLSPNEPNQLVNMPTGIKMIAGSAMPKERQSRAQVFWNYIGESVSYDHIPLGDEWRDLPLQAVIIFPEFWDGEQLDSANHKSHLAYGDGSGAAPDGHPLLLPQLQLQIHYGRISNNLHLLSSDYMSLPAEGTELANRLTRANRQDLSFRNGEAGFAPGWSLHADQIHLPWLETAPDGTLVDGFARREEDALRLPLFAGTTGNAVRPIPAGITQPYSSRRAPIPVLGTSGNDVIRGTAADDRLESLEGDDSLIGGAGADRLIGADGADRFVLESVADSTIAAPDVIFGFGVDDRLDLRALNLSPDSIRIDQDTTGAWWVTAAGTELAVRIYAEEVTAQQILVADGSADV